MANGNADAIFAKLAEAGFKVAVQDERTLPREFVEEFYGEHKGTSAARSQHGPQHGRDPLTVMPRPPSPNTASPPGAAQASLFSKSSQSSCRAVRSSQWC